VVRQLSLPLPWPTAIHVQGGSVGTVWSRSLRGARAHRKSHRI